MLNLSQVWFACWQSELCRSGRRPRGIWRRWIESAELGYDQAHSIWEELLSRTSSRNKPFTGEICRWISELNFGFWEDWPVLRIGHGLVWSLFKLISRWKSASNAKDIEEFCHLLFLIRHQWMIFWFSLGFISIWFERNIDIFLWGTEAGFYSLSGVLGSYDAIYIRRHSNLGFVPWVNKLSVVWLSFEEIQSSLTFPWFVRESLLSAQHGRKRFWLCSVSVALTWDVCLQLNCCFV